MTGKNKDMAPEETKACAELNSEEIDSCGLCAALFSKDQEKSSKPGTQKSSGGAWRFMTEREFGVLKAMRRLREKAVKIKKRIRTIENEMEKASGPGHRTTAAQSGAEEAPGERQMAEELLVHCDRLARLKEQWKEMDLERLAAQEERMRMLGHIQ